MFDLLAVHVDTVVVVLGVHDESPPLPPPGGDVRAVVLVQVLPEVACIKHINNFIIQLLKVFKTDSILSCSGKLRRNLKVCIGNFI